MPTGDSCEAKKWINGAKSQPQRHNRQHQNTQTACGSACNASGSACSDSTFQGLLDRHSVPFEDMPAKHHDVQRCFNRRRQGRIKIGKHALCEASVIVWEALMIPRPWPGVPVIIGVIVLVWPWLLRKAVRSGMCRRFWIWPKRLLGRTWTWGCRIDWAKAAMLSHETAVAAAAGVVCQLYRLSWLQPANWCSEDGTWCCLFV